MATGDYATETQLREQLSDDSSLLSPALLDRAVTASSRAIDHFCGRRFWADATAVARVYRPTDPTLAWVDDISTTTGLVVATDTTGDGAYDTVWDAGDYELEPPNADAGGGAYAWWRIAATGAKTFPAVGRSRRTSLQVTAAFGWSAVPVEIEQACLLKAASLFKRKDAPFGVAGFGEFGPVRISRRMDPDVAELLTPLMRVGVEAV